MTFNAATLLAAIPPGLREPLLDEYRTIVSAYYDRRWLPGELSGGRFCEIVYTILDGYGAGTYAATPSKPSNFPQACRNLENNSNAPRSVQILIPRMLPPLYEIRNNRGVGHVGGDVDPNHMDATIVLSMTSWILAELTRIFHNLSIDEAQQIVDQLVERRTPIVWQDGDIKRVLNPSLNVGEQILLLVASCPAGCTPSDLAKWTEQAPKYVNQKIKHHHEARRIENSGGLVRILPPGTTFIEEKIKPKLGLQ